MATVNKEKRVLRVELDNDVKKVSITGMNGDEKVVMRQELSEDDLDQATGGYDESFKNVVNKPVINPPTIQALCPFKDRCVDSDLR